MRPFQVHLLFDDGDQADQVWDHVILPEDPQPSDEGKSVWACVDRYSYRQGSGFRRFMHGKIVQVYDGRQSAVDAKALAAETAPAEPSPPKPQVSLGKAQLVVSSAA